MLVEGNNFISHYIKNNKPFAAGKIGVTELNMLYYYISNGSLPEVIRHEVENIAGCYPMDNKNDICDINRHNYKLIGIHDMESNRKWSG